MLNEQLMEKIFAHPEMLKIPIGVQASVMKIFEDVMADMHLVAVSPSVNSRNGGADKK